MRGSLRDSKTFSKRSSASDLRDFICVRSKIVNNPGQAPLEPPRPHSEKRNLSTQPAKQSDVKRQSSKKIGVFGHYGNFNYGDESIVAAVIQNIIKYVSDAEIWAFSINPEDTHQRYNIPSFPIRNLRRPGNRQHHRHRQEQDAVRPNESAPAGPGSKISGKSALITAIPFLRPLLAALQRPVTLAAELVQEAKFLRRSYLTVRSLDLLLVSGSNQFLDNFGGPFGFPYTILKWSVLAKMAGVKLAFVSVGAGPLSASLSKMMIRTAIRLADYVSFRDAPSKQLIETKRFKNRGDVFPDLAHSLEHKSMPGPTTQFRTGSKPTIAINPMPVYDRRYWCVASDNRFHDYVRKLGSFATELVRQGYPLFFFNTMLKDEAVIEDVVNAMDADSRDELRRRPYVRSNRSVDSLMDCLSQADIVVATRFHGTVLSLLAERPLLAICYYVKSMALMTEMGEGRFAVDFDTFEISQLLELLQSLQSNYDFHKANIGRHNDRYRSDLAAQYKVVFSLLT